MKKRPIVALIYDFDGTLSPGNMQEFGFIQAIGKTPEEFWRMSDGLAVGQDASNVLSYMKMMFDEAKKNGIKLRRSDFRKFGRHIQLFEGVKEWFGMINEYGESRGVQIEHYINSSGLKEIIEGSPMSSRKANARNRMKMFGRKVRIPPTPAMMPSTSRERSTSLTPTAISPSLINADRLSIPNSRNPFSQSPMVKVRKNTAAMTTRKIGMLQNLCVNTRSAFSVKAS